MKRDEKTKRLRKQVSVVIPTYNGREILEKHLPDVLRAVGERGEICIVDDASTDGTTAFVKEKFPKVKVITHEKNTRFAQSCNDSVDAAKHEIVILLNNDVAPEKDFVEPLVKHFKNENVFAVGCLERNREGIESGRSLGRFQRGMLVHRRAEQQTGATTLWTAGGSMAVRKSLWQKLGGMDVLFKPAYEEDRDLSYRALKMGYEVRFEPDSRVFHDHETTNIREIGASRLRTASYKNMFVFYWKNITDSNLIAAHLLWLPYHLLVGGKRSRGLLLQGFFQALLQLPHILQKRAMLKKQWKLTDKEVLQKVGDA